LLHLLPTFRAIYFCDHLGRKWGNTVLGTARVDPVPCPEAGPPDIPTLLEEVGTKIRPAWRRVASGRTPTKRLRF